jgi:hypothetical protein
MHRTEPPSKEHPHGRVYVTIAAGVGENGYVVVCPVGESQYTDTPDKALESVKRPLNVAAGLVTGWIPILSPREQWDLRTPACDKRHTKNPYT